MLKGKKVEERGGKTIHYWLQNGKDFSDEYIKKYASKRLFSWMEGSMA